MIRPKFTIASLLMLTTIVAIAAVTFGNRFRIDHLEALLARHEAVRSQALLVQQRQLELRAACPQMQPQLQTAALYGMNGFGDSPQQRTSGTLAPDAAPAWQGGMQLNMPLGYRCAVSYVQNVQLRLEREQAILSQLEQELWRTQSESGW
jgi:hypothetical protein